MIVVRVLNVILVLFFCTRTEKPQEFNSLQKLGRFLDVPDRCNKRFKLPDADAENFREFQREFVNCLHHHHIRVYV